MIDILKYPNQQVGLESVELYDMQIRAFDIMFGRDGMNLFGLDSS